MATIHDVADYMILRLSTGGQALNQLKLQKLLYYVQAWHLAHYRRSMFPERFQAWVHGPVNRELYNRFKDAKSLYSPMLQTDVRAGFSPNALNDYDRKHIDAVLDVYAHLQGDQLEELTHREDPWILARQGYSPEARCEVEIDESVMGEYYRRRIGA